MRLGRVYKNALFPLRARKGLAAGLSILAVTLATALGAATASAALSPTLVPSEGALFGIFGAEREGRTGPQEVAYLEGKIGRKFDIDKEYYRWDKRFPSAREESSVANGRIPMVNWIAYTVDGTTLSWRAIANGAHDALIRQRADEVKAFGSKLFVVFHHEPENDSQWHGSSADYRAAWRHIVSVFDSRGATNVVWVWNMMAYTFSPSSGRQPADWYPGDQYVDWLAANGYNWYGSSHVQGQRWRPFEDVFQAFYTWGSTRAKPLAILEFGVLEDTSTPIPERKAQWLLEAAATIKSWPNLKAVVYFNGLGWWFDSSWRATNAFAQWGRDPYFRQDDAPPPGPQLLNVALTAPAAESSVRYRSEVELVAAVSGGSGVDRVEFKVNGSDRCTDKSAPFTCSWTVWSAVGSKNTLKATVFDAAGNSAEHRIWVYTKG